MASHQLEIHLESVNRSSDWDDRVTLSITAYTEETEYINKNTFIFDCNPVGSNCERVYLEVEFPDQEVIADIHQFLAHHLQKNDEIERVRRVPVVNAKRSSTWATGRRRETEDFDHLEVTANSKRISFGPLATMTPNIRFYETATEEGPQNRQNGERLLDFLEELIGDTNLHTNVSLQDDELVERCLPLFDDRRYKAAAQLAGQLLEERIAEHAPDELENQFDGANLMRQALSPDNGPIQIASRNGEQAGLMSMFAGSYQAIRNPLSHRTPDPDGEKYLDDLDRAQTRNILHTVDYLLTTLERNLE